MDETELVALLQAEEQNAVGYYNSEIAAEQEKALKYYNGEPFGNEEEGRSQVVSRDVATTIDSIMPDLIKVFVSGDNVVEFTATKQGDEQFAEQATDYVNHIFFKDNDGFTITHDWAKDGLMNKIGVVKVYWNDDEKKSREVYEGLDEESVMMLAQEAEIIEATTDEETGLIDVTVIRSEDMGRVRIENIPPEEFLVSLNTRLLIDSDYTAHRSYKTKSELIEMGFDKAVVMELSGNGKNDEFDGRAVERYKDQDFGTDDQSSDPAMEKLWVVEEYVKVDYDGDGIAELRKITRVHNDILENIEVEEHPFVDFTPIKLPHRVFGKSLADDTIDIQLVKSTLLRQSLDNIYITNNPRIEVPDSIVNEDTFDDLLTVAPGAPIRTKGAGGLRPITIPSMAAHALQMMEYFDGEKEERTGVTRLNQGLDADTLNKTATGIAMIQNKGMGKIELIARNYANSFGHLFRKILRLVVKFQDKERIIMLRGKWTPIEPSMWNADMKVTAQVGLGTGDKNERIQFRYSLLDLQKQALEMGLSQPEHLYNNISKLCRDMELGDADQYFIDPKNAPEKPPEKPSPEEIKAQADAQAAQKKQEFDQQKLEQDGQIAREKIQMEAQIRREQMSAEFALKREEMQMEMALKAAGTPGSVGNIELGGDLG